MNYRETAETADDGISPWLAGVRLDAFEGDFDVQVASAAHAIGADILSPADIASSVVDPTLPEYVPFTTREMVERAHSLGMLVKPWTVRLFFLNRSICDDEYPIGQPFKHCGTALRLECRWHDHRLPQHDT